MNTCNSCPSSGGWRNQQKECFAADGSHYVLRAANRVTCSAIATVWLVSSLLVTYIACERVSAEPRPALAVRAEKLEADGKQPPSREVEQAVIAAFRQSHDGYSVDEVLLDDARRDKFLSEANRLLNPPGHPETDADAICAALLHVRKAGGRLPKSTKRATAREVKLASGEVLESAIVLPLAEIAARQLYDHLGEHTDALLISQVSRAFFDECIQKLVDVEDTYAFRKAAIQLRKARRLEPELLSRVTDWKREIITFAVQQIVDDATLVPTRPGVYIFRDQSGYLYVGQASNLRTRLASHVNGSDRFALAEYLSRDASEEVRVEVHVFKPSSPGEKLTTRRAYESELIRTRKPKLNLAP